MFSYVMSSMFSLRGGVYSQQSLILPPVFTGVSGLTVLFVGWRLKKTDIYDEFTNGGTLRPNVRIFGVLWILIRYVAPVAVLAIFISGLIG